MFCNKCGSNVGESKFCPECGSPSHGPIPEGNREVVDDALAKGGASEAAKSSRGRRWIPFAILVALMLIAASQGKTLFGMIAGTDSGLVTLDSSKVETLLVDGLLEQAGETVTSWCPNPLAAKVGEVRQCQVTDSTGKTYLVDITIQNTQGDISWRLDN